MAVPTMRAGTLSIEGLLEQIREVSLAICGQAQTGEWDGIETLDVRRRRLLEEYFSQGDAARMESHSEALRELAVLDQEIMESIRKARHEVSDALKKLNNGRHAARAYKDCGG